MQKLNFDLLKTYKSDFIAILAWIILYLILLCLTFQKWGSPLIDCGRDVYVAEQFLRGDRLYTDIYYVYGPLAIYVLSGLFFVFGVHLNVAYFCGICFSVLSLILIYSISRTLLSPLFSFLVTANCIVLCCFNSGIFNYIFPYTYSALIGMFLGLLLVFSLVKHLICKNSIYIYLAGIATGLSSLTKIEFFTASICLFILYILLENSFKNKAGKKALGLSVLIALIIPVLSSLFILISSGVDKIQQYFLYSKMTLSSEASLFIIKEYFGWANFVSSFHLMLSYLPKLILFIVCMNFFIFILLKIGLHKRIALIVLAVVSFFLIYVKFFSPDTILLMMVLKYIFASYIPIAITIYLLFLIIYNFILRNSFTITHKILLILSFYSLLLTLRCYFHLSILLYGVFYIPLVLIIVVYLAVNVPNNKYNFKIKNFHYYWFSMLAVLQVIFLITPYSGYLNNLYTLETSKGRIISDKIIAKPLQELSEYVIKNTKPTEEIVLIPEETLVYFLTSRKSSTRFYDYLPIRLVNPDLEQEFIKTIKHKNIRLIAISNRSSEFYNFNYWGVDYNQKINSWIQENYKLCKTFGHYHTTEKFLDPYGIKVYMKQCP